MKREIGLGLVLGTRGFFNPELAKRQRDILLETFNRVGIRLIMLDKEATPTGGIETLGDAHRCADFFQEHRKEIHGIVISLPNFGDEIAAVLAVKLARLDVPVLLHAVADEQDKVDVKNRRDAYCGKLSVANNLRQYGIPFSLTERHVYHAETSAFDAELKRFAAVCRVVHGMKNARIGAIGARPAAFQTVRTSEKLLQSAGISVVPVDLSDIHAAANALKSDDPRVLERIAQTRSYGTVPDHITPPQVEGNARFQVAVIDWLDQNEIDAFTIQCWTSMQLNFGCAACTVMSMEGEELRPGACEVDINGAISMYALSLATLTPAAITDWNNNVGDEEDLVAGVHCGNYPRSFHAAPFEVSELDILGENLGAEKCFGAVKGQIAPGPMTYLRLSTDDVDGKLRAYSGEGEFVTRDFPIAGGVALSKVPRLEALMKYIMRNGFEHHVSLVRGHVAEVIEEAFARYLDIETYVHS